jgi:hypothetical protein
VEISNGAVSIGGRWDTFQSRLRQRGKEAAAGCKTYIVYAVFERDSADILGKAVQRLFSGEVAWESHGFGRGLFPSTAH